VSNRVVVTGGAGFIGSALVRKIISDTDWNVLNIDKLTYAGHIENIGDVLKDSRHQFLQLDITNRELIEPYFNEFNPTHVIHLAAESHVDRSIVNSLSFINTNIIGTYNLLNICHEYLRKSKSKLSDFKFIHVSTDEVYGSLGAVGKFDENSPYNPNSPYSASKASSDHLVRAWNKTFDLPTIITNCSNNYGPYQYTEKLIPLMINNAIARNKLPVYGKGENVRDWLHVEDHVNALIKILESGLPGSSYCIGGGNEIKNIDLVYNICDFLDQYMKNDKDYSYRNLIEYVDNRPGHDFRYALNTEKINKDILWSPKIEFSEGLESTIKWYLDNQNWCKSVSKKDTG